jgi:hypothetical protein
MISLQAQELFIDAFAVNRDPIGTVPPSERISPGAVISSHRPVLRPPFEVTLVALDAPNYIIPTTEPFAFEVALKNIGAQPTDVPTSVDNSQIRGNESGARWIGIAPVSDNTSSDSPGILGEVLYGSPSVPGSLVTINPGGSVTIRARGFWLKGLALGVAVRTLSLRAVLQMTIAGQDTYETAYSDNSLNVHVRRR